MRQETVKHEHSFAGREGNYRCVCGVTRPDRDDKLPVHRMNTRDFLHLLRNPYGHAPEDIRDVRLAAADRLEELEKQLEYAHDAYVNMRDWAITNGLNVTTYGGKPVGTVKSAPSFQPPETCHNCVKGIGH